MREAKSTDIRFTFTTVLLNGYRPEDRPSVLKHHLLSFFLLVLLAAGNSAVGGTKEDLGGTSWQLIRFVDSEHQALRPDQRVRYTIAFESDGGVTVRSGCSRGGGSWKSSGSNLVEFGPLRFARAKCRLTAMDDRLPSDLQYVRSYFLRDGHLFLSLLAEQGCYEFEPAVPYGGGEAGDKPHPA